MPQSIFVELTDGGVDAMMKIIWNKLRTIPGSIAAVVMLTLIIGLFLGSPVGRIVCGVCALALASYLVIILRRDGAFDSCKDSWRVKETNASLGHVLQGQKELYSHPEEGDMKKLLFDDLQAPSSGYMIKEVQEEESVVPSTRAAQPVVTAKEEKVKEFDIGDFFDLESDIFRNETEPRSEFNFLLNKLLLAMKDVLFAHTVAFFWANREKQQMVLEAMATNSQNFIATKRYAIDQDIVSQVAKSGKPQVLGRVSALAEKDLIRHYQSCEDIKSLIVVPVYYLTGSANGEHLPEGVIVADSKAEDAFGSETLALMGHFTKMISALIKSYTNKYDLLLDSELLTSIRRQQDRVKSERSEQSVLDSLADEAGKLVNWDVLAVTMYSEETNGWILQKVVNRSDVAYPAAKDAVDFAGSIVGRVIRTNTLAHVNDVETETECRFSSGENIPLAGSFLCVPISSLNRCYGALTLESGKKFQFSPLEAEVIYRLVENAAELLEVLYMNDLVKEYIAVDHLTGSLNAHHFTRKVEEEVVRAEDFRAELALVSVAIDNVQEHMNRHGRECLDTILNQVAKLIRVNIQPYDVIGRSDSNTLSVLLVNTTANDAYLWAEKVRKHIASNLILVSGLSCSVTVSAGVCGLNEGMNKEELLAGTSQVLTKAMEGGGNLVRVF